MKHHPERLIPVFFMLVLLLSACATKEPIQNNEEWTKPDEDPESCDMGSATINFVSKLEITPVGDATTTIWFSYNGSHCPDFHGAASQGMRLQWHQIAENVYGELLVRIYDDEIQKTGWIYCRDVTFLNTLEDYAEVLPMAKYNLLEKCYQESGGGG